MKPVMVLLKKAESNMEEGNSKMEIKILQTEEVPKAVQLARGVFEVEGEATREAGRTE